MRTRGSRFFAPAWIGLVVLYCGLPVTTGAEGGHPLCVDSCNATRAACDDACDGTCSALFPNNADLRNACLSQCHASCVDQQQECKSLCHDVIIP